MKLTSLLVLAACLQVSARTYSQTVSFSERNAPLEKVFSIIERQTGYTFYYKVELLRQARAVYATCNNMELEQALQVIFKDQPLAYNIVDRNIVVSEKKMTAEKTGIAPPAAPPVVRGRILDSLGNPVAGASIMIKGGSRTFMSADDGSFEIKNADPQSVLVISSVGYRSSEIAVNGRTYISIQLHQQPDKLSELTVVSTGYQRIKQYQMTGAVAVLSEKDYDQRVAVSGNFLESLEGKIPGLVYNSQSGELSIRGVATFSAVKQPLIIVDGFPTEINLLTINPNDIISINVLRDAAASAIYGVRASNGVIVVETRRGRSGKAQFNLRATTALQPKPDFAYLKYAPASEYAQLEAAMITTANQGSLLNLYANSLGYPLSPVQNIMVKKYLNTITADQAAEQVAAVGAYDNLSEYERLFYQPRLTSNVNFDVSGGSERASYMLGFNYVGDRLVNRRSTNRQYNVNLANTVQLNSRMKFDFKGVYTNGTNVSGNTPGYGFFYPYEHLADSAGNALPVSTGLLIGSGRNNSINAVSAANNATNMAAGLYDGRYYPYRELTSNTLTNQYSSIRLQGRLNVILTPWMNVDIGGNYENQQSTLDTLQKEDAFKTRMLLNLSALRDASTGKAQFTNIPQGDILKRTSQKLINYTVRVQLNLNKRFGTDHTLSGILGLEQRKLSTDAFSTSYFGYDGQTLLNKPVNMVAMNNLGISNSAFPTVGSIIGVGAGTAAANYFNQANRDSRFMSYYGDGTYTFKDKYIATGSLRLDQSNLFGSDPKYRNKPLWSAGLAWRMMKEDFMERLTWLNDLKLRVATGFTGNIPSSNNGKFLLLTAGVTTLFPTAQTYYTVSSPENESLRWETTKNYNFGLDYALFGSRVFGTVDYYIKKSVDVFGTFGADPTSGFNSYNANTASIMNRGLELMITSANIRGRRVRWNTTVTASFNHNEVLTVKSTAYSASYSYVSSSQTQNVQGKPLGALFSYNYGGLTALGQPTVLDAKGNSKIINGTSIDVLQSDLIYNGTTTPKYVLGLNNQLSVGDFDLSFLFMYYGGHVMRVEAPSPNSTFNPSPIQGSSNYWKKPGDEKNTLIPALPLGSSLATGYYSAFAAYGYYYASNFVRKADYIRLRDVVVTWNIRGAALQKMGLQQPQLRLQVQNAFRYTFSGNDIDPEAIDRIGGHRYLPQQPMYSLSFYCKF